MSTQATIIRHPLEHHAIEALTARRQALGWTVAELAATSGITAPHIHNLEAGRRGLTFYVAAILASAMMLELGDLTKGFDDG